MVSHQWWLIIGSKCYIQSTYIPRGPQCLSPRPNWGPPITLAPASECGWGGGGPNSDDWRNSLVLHTVIRFLWVSANFSTCTVVRVNGTLVEDKMLRFKGECEHFRFNKCPIYTHDGASAKFSTNSQETDNSACPCSVVFEDGNFRLINWKNCEPACFMAALWVRIKTSFKNTK